MASETNDGKMERREKYTTKRDGMIFWEDWGNGG